MMMRKTGGFSPLHSAPRRAYAQRGLVPLTASLVGIRDALRRFGALPLVRRIKCAGQFFKRKDLREFTRTRQCQWVTVDGEHLSGADRVGALTVAGRHSDRVGDWQSAFKAIAHHVLILLLFAAPVSAQQLSWQQEAEINPSSWTYRIYFNDGPALLSDVVCQGNPPEFDCLAPLPVREGWVWAYLSVENEAGESLPSNPIYSVTPIELTKPRPPKNLRRVP